MDGDSTMSLIEQILLGILIGLWAPFFIAIALFMLYAGKRNGGE